MPILSSGGGRARPGILGPISSPSLSPPDRPCDRPGDRQTDHPDLGQVVARLRAAGCVFAEDEAHLLISETADGSELAERLDRRVRGEPLEHLLGWAEFDGLRVGVGPGVFVPRRRSELLVREGFRFLREVAASRSRGERTPHQLTGAMPHRRRVLDLCCGCGALAAALVTRWARAALDVADLEVHATDSDPVAVGWARRNLAGTGQVHCGDLFSALPGHLAGRLDLVMVNAPYVPTSGLTTMPPEARLHEPRAALDGGPDGLDVQRRAIAQLGSWLAPSGAVMIETGRAQAPVTSALAQAQGLVARVVHEPELEATIVIGLAPVRGPVDLPSVR